MSKSRPSVEKILKVLTKGLKEALKAQAKEKARAENPRRSRQAAEGQGLADIERLRDCNIEVAEKWVTEKGPQRSN